MYVAERAAAAPHLFSGMVKGDTIEAGTADAFVVPIWREASDEPTLPGILGLLTEQALRVSELLVVPVSIGEKSLVRLSPLQSVDVSFQADICIEFVQGPMQTQLAGLTISEVFSGEMVGAAGRPAGSVSAAALWLMNEWCLPLGLEPVALEPGSPYFFDPMQGKASPLPIVVTRRNSDSVTCLMKVVLFLNWAHELEDGQVSVVPKEVVIGVLDIPPAELPEVAPPLWSLSVDGPQYVPVFGPVIEKSDDGISGVLASIGYTKVKLTPEHSPSVDFPHSSVEEYRWFVKSGDEWVFVPNSGDLANPVELTLEGGNRIYIQHPRQSLHLAKGALLVTNFIGAETFEVVFECHLRSEVLGDPLAVLRTPLIKFAGRTESPEPIVPQLRPVELSKFLTLPEEVEFQFEELKETFGAEFLDGYVKKGR